MDLSSIASNKGEDDFEIFNDEEEDEEEGYSTNSFSDEEVVSEKSKRILSTTFTVLATVLAEYHIEPHATLRLLKIKVEVDEEADNDSDE